MHFRVLRWYVYGASWTGQDLIASLGNWEDRFFYGVSIPHDEPENKEETIESDKDSTFPPGPAATFSVMLKLKEFFCFQN